MWMPMIALAQGPSLSSLICVDNVSSPALVLNEIVAMKLVPCNYVTHVAEGRLRRYRQYIAYARNGEGA